MNEWSKSTLGEILPLKYGKNLPAPKRAPGEIPVYSSAGHTGYHDTPLAPGPCVVVGRKGSVGTVYYEDRSCFPIDTTFYTVGSAKVDLKFGYYALLNANLAQHSQDSAVPGLNRDRYSEINISLPPLQEQKKIVAVLGALDNKIAANTKLASTADQWVRAKYDLINYQSSEERAVGDLVSHRRKAVDPVSLETPVPYVGLEHIPRRLMWLNSHGSSEEVTSNKSFFHAGDILFGKLRPYFHKVVTAPASGICSTDVLVLASKEEIFSGYVLASLAHDDVIQAVTALSAGTRMPRTNWKDLSQVIIPWPGDLVATAFSERVQIIRKYVVGLIAENETLAATRDALLPQLMSGKLRVKEAEKVVEDSL